MIFPWFDEYKVIFQKLKILLTTTLILTSLVQAEDAIIYSDACYCWDIDVEREVIIYALMHLKLGCNKKNYPTYSLDLNCDMALIFEDIIFMVCIVRCSSMYLIREI